MTKYTLNVAKDDVGRMYAYQCVYELDKNHRADAAGSVTEVQMYSTVKADPVFDRTPPAVI